jgi:chorismate synthase
LAIAPEEFRRDLTRRATGTSRYTSQRHEADDVEILSGVYAGTTTGTPIALLIRNTDARSKDYNEIKDVFRPGHADYTYWQKYGIRDHRGGGRASARETTMRVAAGVVAKKWLREKFQVSVRGWLAQLGPLTPKAFAWDAVDANPFFWPDAAMVPELENYIDALRKSGDSIGARVNVVADSVPPGWGEPIYGKLDGELASALMSINAVKGVEIGAGFGAVTQRGSEHRDEMLLDGFTSNHAGGILGGISTGQAIVASIALKPASSILIPGRTLNVAGEVSTVRTKGRHDPCVGIRATPIAEAMVALVLMDQAMRHRAQCGDVGEVKPRIPAGKA